MVRNIGLWCAWRIKGAKKLRTQNTKTRLQAHLVPKPTTNLVSGKLDKGFPWKQLHGLQQEGFNASAIVTNPIRSNCRCTDSSIAVVLLWWRSTLARRQHHHDDDRVNAMQSKVTIIMNGITMERQSLMDYFRIHRNSTALSTAVVLSMKSYYRERFVKCPIGSMLPEANCVLLKATYAYRIHRVCVWHTVCSQSQPTLHERKHSCNPLSTNQIDIIS